MKGELLGLLVIKKPTTDYVGLCTQAIHHPTRTSGSVDAISEIGYIGDLCFSWLKWWRTNHDTAKAKKEKRSSLEEEKEKDKEQNNNHDFNNFLFFLI